MIQIVYLSDDSTGEEKRLQLFISVNKRLLKRILPDFIIGANAHAAIHTPSNIYYMSIM